MHAAISPDRRSIPLVIRQTAREHGELLAKARAIETMIEGPTGPAAGDVARKLRALGEYLAAHIAEEEESALYTWIPEAYPELRADVERHRLEHGPLVIALRQLAEEAESAADVGMESDMGMRIRATLASLRQHEAGESSVLQRALADSRQ
jgi:hypothetical protein